MKLTLLYYVFVLIHVDVIVKRIKKKKKKEILQIKSNLKSNLA